MKYIVSLYSEDAPTQTGDITHVIFEGHYSDIDLFAENYWASLGLDGVVSFTYSTLYSVPVFKMRPPLDKMSQYEKVSP